jgi:hypothetical protein
MYKQCKAALCKDEWTVRQSLATVNEFQWPVLGASYVWLLRKLECGQIVHAQNILFEWINETED